MIMKQKIKLISGIVLIVASPFLGIGIAHLLHPVTCEPDIPGRLQMFNCLVGDFWVWIISLVIALTVGITLLVSLFYDVRQKSRKKKQNILFVITWTKITKTKVTKQGIVHLVSTTLVVLGIVALGLISNVIPFGYAVIRCGQLPVELTKFMADYSYRLPEDKGYRVNVFSEYTFCTQEQIKATNGYHRNVNTDAAKAETEANRIAREEAESFSTSKVDYQVYTPKLEGYVVENLKVSEINSSVQTFFSLRKINTNIGFSFREGKIPSSYQICRLEQSQCLPIGIDKYGNTVQKQISGSAKSPIVYYGVNREGTFINIGQGAHVNYSDEDMINIINSLEPYQG